MNPAGAIGQSIMLAFHGTERPSSEIQKALEEYRPAGITLFRSLNIESPAQLRGLTQQLQQRALEFGMPPLLIATDQEGGQLMAIGEGTPLPGNMAIGATGSEELARRAGEVLGRELAAMGVNVNYAPCVDVNLNPYNPVVGVRSFGENPDDVARLGAAMVQGIQSQGVAATAKHFPGHGDTISDSHRELAIVPHSLQRLRSVEFVPFRAAIQARAQMIMTAHLGLSALDGEDAPPATLSSNVLRHTLREELGFEGVIITDALDMQAIKQGAALGGEALKAIRAGADLLLVTSDPQDQRGVFDALVKAAESGEIEAEDLQRSAARIQRLKDWLLKQQAQPDLDVIRCERHMETAQEIAERSVTLVRNNDQIIPVRPHPQQRIMVIMPKPQDLTPADTSSYITPRLAEAIEKYHPSVDKLSIPYAPGETDIRLILQSVLGYDLIIIGTLNAFNQAGQTALVREILKTGTPTIVVALRLPYDLLAFPEAATYLCTYSLLEPSLEAAAKCMFGRAGFQGRLPVTLPRLYEAGFSWNR